ncbi:MAG: ATPase synthesis protein 25 mitochondrial [Pleopsidium flavum]|nr:MAG: ATPase synthesis protein 25 mitochondrial [Pleopsidium flavum]
MIVSKAVTSTSGCKFCHLALFKSFASLAGVRLDPQRFVTAPRHSRNSTLYIGQPRALSALTWRSSNVLVLQENIGVADDEVEILSKGENAIDSSAASAAPVPWYLQVETPQSQAYPLSDRQRLPDIPVDSPPLLEPLLRHISIDLGLDDLSLFDLRELDPPPALGANLLMVLGTARSERHLHVSADRLCRWLRSTRQLNPSADGLLGRNELKLKMRRKARRAKLLGSVGAIESSNVDDGVRTGWVCVNVGTVESGKGAPEETAEAVEFVGFGSRGGGVKIVIQMLTEEKRGELDLEDLWGGMLKRQAKRRSRNLEIEQQQQSGEEVGPPSNVRIGMTSDLSLFVTARYRQPTPSSQVQTRALHSSAKICQQDAVDEGLVQYPDLDPASVEPRLQSPLGIQDMQPDAAISFTKRADHKSISKPLQEAIADTNHPHNFGDLATVLTLQAHLKHLRNLPRDAALEALGEGANDSSSTSFLSSFYQTLSKVRHASQWESEIDLVCYAIELAHPGYPKSNLAQILGQMRKAGVNVSEITLTKGLKTALLRNGTSSLPGECDNDTDWISPMDMTMAVELVEELSHRGRYSLTEEASVMLQEAVGIGKPSRRSGKGGRMYGNSIGVSRGPYSARERLRELMNTFDVEYISTDSCIRMLRLYAKEGLWTGFWEFWRDIARCMRPRSATLYAYIFHAMAETNHQINCTETLRAWIPEMEREQPPVKLEGQVAEAVKECLLVVDPNVKTYARRDSDVKGEWVPLWLKCESALHERPWQGVHHKA